MCLMYACYELFLKSYKEDAYCPSYDPERREWRLVMTQSGKNNLHFQHFYVSIFPQIS